MSYIHDFQVGRIAEQHFADYFSNTAWTATVVPNTRFTDYDVSITSGSSNITFEIKVDRLAPKTNNVAIEIGRDEKPTGLSLSKADYFVVRINDIYHAVKTTVLKQYIEDNAEYLRVKQVGDGWRTTCVLISLNEFMKMVVFSLNDYVLIQSMLPVIKRNK